MRPSASSTGALISDQYRSPSSPVTGSRTSYFAIGIGSTWPVSRARLKETSIGLLPSSPRASGAGGKASNTGRPTISSRRRPVSARYAGFASTMTRSGSITRNAVGRAANRAWKSTGTDRASDGSAADMHASASLVAPGSGGTVGVPTLPRRTGTLSNQPRWTAPCDEVRAAGGGRSVEPGGQAAGEHEQQEHQDDEARSPGNTTG